MKKILITGGSGFIGANLIMRLSKMDQYEITVFDISPPHIGQLPPHIRFIQGDLRDANLVRKMIVDDSIDIVYHLAWGTIHETATRDPLEDVNINVAASLILLDACIHTQVNRIIYVSSGGTVYGLPEQLPITEDHPTHPINAYGVSKLTVEKYLQMFSYLHGLDYVIFRPSVPYGPFQNPHRRQGAVSVFTYNALKGKPIVVWGREDIVRDYFFIDDLIDALVLVLANPNVKNKTFNLSGKESISLHHLLETIQETLHIDPVIHHEKERLIDAPQLILDSSAAKQSLGWSPKVDLKEGVRLTANWLRAHFF